MFKDLIDLARQQGPVTAAWITLFVVVAYLAGQGGKAALANVKGLLQQSEDLRQSLNDQLNESNRRLDLQSDIIGRMERQLRDQQRDILAAQAQTADLQTRLMQSQILQQSLATELLQLRGENDRLRISLPMQGGGTA